MTNRRNNRARGTSRGSMRRGVSHRQLRNELTGINFRGSFDPPRVVAIPWNTVTLSGDLAFSSAAINTYGVNQVASFMRTLMVMANSQPLSFRFVSVSIWTLSPVLTSGALVQRTAMNPYDLVSPSPGRARQWIEDEGTITRPAHVHHLWSIPEQMRVFTSGNDPNQILFSIDTPEEGVGLHFQIRVLWKCAGGNPIPSQRASASLMPMDPLVEID